MKLHNEQSLNRVKKGLSLELKPVRMLSNSINGVIRVIQK